jgi:RecA/RadA recombinase
MFGKKAASRIEILNVDTEDEAEQMSIQEWKKEIIGIMDEGPCIYALDSVDGLTTDEEKKRIKAEKAGKKPAGTMGMEKAKHASSMLREVCGGLAASKSYLQANFQTREDIDPMTFTTKTRAGGKAWKFYAQHEWWLANARMNAKIKKERQGRKRQIGITSTAKMTKNKFTGKAGWEITMPMYFGYGIDDVGSCVDWLVTEGWWGKSGQTIDAEDLNIKGTRAKIISLIEDGDMEPQLQKVVAEAWVEIEKDYQLERKPRFGD